LRWRSHARIVETILSKSTGSDPRARTRLITGDRQCPDYDAQSLPAIFAYLIRYRKARGASCRIGIAVADGALDQ
jgi:hypothetical protein